MVAKWEDETRRLMSASAALQEACADARFIRLLIASRSKARHRDLVQQSRERIRASRALLEKTANAVGR